MKHLFTTLVLATAATLSGQATFSLEDHATATAIEPGGTIYASVDPEDTKKHNIDLVNTSAESQTYGLKRYDITLNSNGTETAAAFFCYAGACNSPGLYVSNEYATLEPGQKTSGLKGEFQMLLAELTEISVAGFSHVKYTFYNISNPADSVQFNIRYNDNSAGISGQSFVKSGIALAPNPASGNTNALIALPYSTHCTISIYNTLGALVGSTSKMLPAGTSSVPLDIDQLTKGMYFVSLDTGKDRTVRRLIIN